MYEASEQLRRFNAQLQDQVEARTRELRLARDTALETNRTQADFFATMSHELRTPLSAILATTELLLESGLSNEQRTMLRRSLSSCEALLHIVDDLLDVARIDAGHLELRELAFDPRELIEAVCDSLAVRAAQQSLPLVCDVSPGMPNKLRGDPQRIRQILVNLVGNAVKFTPSGEVIVRATWEEALRVEVVDTGPGIPSDEQTRIFERFVRAARPGGRGTGLGLSISRSLVERMSGSLELESEVGHGSTFRFEIPLPVEEQATRPRDLSDVALAVLDTHEPSREALTRVLRAAGARIVDAKSAQLVLVDHGSVSELPKQSIAILLSDRPRGAASTGDAISARAVLPKPFRRNELVGEIRAALGMTKRKRASVHQARTAVDRHRVLLAEDDPDNRGLIVRWLKRHGLEVEVARDGEVALEKLSRRHFDLVLTDLEMPNIDGLTLTKTLREREQDGRQRTPVVLLTAHALPDTREAARAAGVDRFVAKPYRTEVLLEAIHACLDPKPVVLIVDDDASSRELLQAWTRSRYHPVVASSGTDALEIVRNRRVSVAFIDLQMPGMSGLECVRAMRVLSRKLPIVAMTASTDTETERRCRESGFDAVHTKPFTRDAFYKAVEGCLAPPVETDEPHRPAADVEDLLEPFFVRRWEDVDKLQTALKTGDLESARRIGHGLKGVGGAYGFPALTELGGAIETAAGAGNPSEVRSLKDALETELLTIVLQFSDGRVVSVRDLRPVPDRNTGVPS